MSSCADIVKASARAKRGRVPVLLAVMLAFIVSLAPYSVQGNFSKLDSSCRNPVHDTLDVVQNKAYAYDPGQALSYLDTLAQAAGVTNSQLVAGLSGMASVATGMILATEAGQSLSASLADNLNHMVYASTFVDWDDLDSTEQARWSSREDYETYYFSELCQAYGLPSVNQFYGSGGGALNETENEKLSQIGRVIDKWIKKGSVAFGDLKALITNRSAVYDYLGIAGTQQEGVFDGSEIEDWPSGVPTNVIYAADVNTVWVNYTNTRNWTGYYQMLGSDVIYGMIFTYTVGTTNYFKLLLFSKETFTCTSGSMSELGGPMDSTRVRTYSGQEGDCYYAEVSISNLQSLNYSSVTPNYFFANNLEYLIAYHILYGQSAGSGSTGNYEPDMPGYPEGGSDDISDSQPIYYPPTVNNNTTYNNYTNPQYPNPYNPENETDSEEWQNETGANIENVKQNLKLEKLFPFSLLYDITALADKVKDVTVEQQASGVYDVISIPINLPFLQDTIDIDLSDLHGLLLGTRIFIQILLATSLLFATIRLWSGVLGGQ